MIISKKYGERLITDGKARAVGTCIDNNRVYMTLIRTDIQRVDHYLYETRRSVI